MLYFWLMLSKVSGLEMILKDGAIEKAQVAEVRDSVKVFEVG